MNDSLTSHPASTSVLAVIRIRCVCCHSNETRALIANPHSRVQLGGIHYHSPELHSDPCSTVGVVARDRHTHTDTQMAVNTIHSLGSVSYTHLTLPTNREV